MKKQFRTAMLSTACMLVVAVMSLTGVTYAWFTQGENAKITGMDVTVATAAGGIELSLDNQTWQQSLDLAATKDLAGINPLSTVNAKNFFTGAFSKVDSSKLITTAATENYVSANVISFDLYLRTTAVDGMTVTFDGSYIMDIANSGTTTDIGKAARIAILDEDGNLMGIMAPYSEDSGANITKDVSTYIGIAGASSADGFKPSELVEKVSENIELQNPVNVEVALAGPEGTATEGAATKITVVIWLEGQDSDCINLNAGGAFNTYLNIQKKGTTVVPETPVDGE